MADSASSATGRLPRHSDGGSTVTAVAAQQPKGGGGSKKGSRRRKGLNTLSAPLTPLAGVTGPLDPRSSSPTHLQQQLKPGSSNKPPPAAAGGGGGGSTPSRLGGGRRNTQSDAGQPPSQQQPQVLFTQHSVSEGQEYNSNSAPGISTNRAAAQHACSSGTSSSEAVFHAGLMMHDGAGGKAAKQLQWQQPLQPPLAQQQQQQVYQQQQLQPQQQQPQHPQQMLAGPPPPAAPPALPQGPFSTGASGSSAAAAAATAAAAPPQRVTLQHAASLEGPFLDPPPTLWEFFYAEATPHEKYPTADVLWRQTERDRVYNFLLYVPYQLERIMIFGTMLCVYSFLGALTALPLRCLWALWRLLSNLLLPSSRRSRQAGSRPSLLPGAQLYDLLCVLLMLGAVVVLSRIKPAVLYYWMKDITSEFLKIQVLFTALEICDKILSNFGVDVLEALSSTCTLYTQSGIGLMQLLSDLLVAFLLITAHGGVLMCQAMVFAVTMNSKRNALLALMIATNFVELKGQVYKRTDTNKLWALACQDIVERFQLVLVLCFVVVEDISNSGTWWPAPGTLLECGRIFLWEIVIDISKHAVLGKFNDIRPGIYKEYMRDLCSDSLDKHSHNTHKLVGFCPLGPAALSLRMVHTLLTLKCDGQPDWQLRCAVLLVSWMAACATQVVLGYSLKWLAFLYVRHHALQAGGKVLPRAINVTPSGIKLLAPSGAGPTAVSTAVKASAAAAAAGAAGNAAASSQGASIMPPLTPAFSPKGGLQQLQMQMRAVGTATAASGASPLAGTSPAPSPSGSSAVWPLSGQLPTLNNSSSNKPGAAGGTSTLQLQAAAAAAAAAAQHTLPSSIQQQQQQLVGSSTAAGLLVQQQGAPAAAAGLASNSMAAGAGSSSNSFSSVNGLTSPAMLAAALGTNSAPPAPAPGSSLGLPAGAAAAAAAAGGGDMPAAQAQLQLIQDLGLVLTPGTLRVAGVSIAGRAGGGAGSRPSSPFSSGAQLQPFAGRHVETRASFSDARPGWDGEGLSSSYDASGAGQGTTLQDSVFSSKEAPAAVSGPDTVGVVPAGGSAAAGSVKAAATAAQSSTSSYSGVSAGGLVGRGVLQQPPPQQPQEQEWQQPKSRHRAKRE